MCGILGIGGPRRDELIRSLVGDLAHRGPDDEAVWVGPGLALGHRRLAIIGLDLGGRQPFAAADGGSHLSFNGEIYNYLELADRLEAEGRAVDRRYDTAVLLTALEAWGVDALAQLNGMFALAWYRADHDSVLLARDRWGKKPLFWGRVPVGSAPALVFSSELRTFARLPAGPPPPDPLGIARYLAYDGMPGTRTVYRGVAKVAPGGWLELDTSGRIRRQGTFWQADQTPRRQSLEEAVERFEADLELALSLRLRSDVPVGLFLSGGLDSSLLAVLWRRLQPNATLRTFTVGFEDASYDERGPARQVAELIGSEHHELLLAGSDLEAEVDAIWEHLSEPFADPSLVPTSLLCRFAAREVKVALGGDGGDELQAGYDPFRAWGTARTLERILPRRLWRRVFSGLESLLPASDRNMSWRFKARHFGQGFATGPEERVQAWLASFPVDEILGLLRPELASQVDPEEVLEPTRRAFRRVGIERPVAAQVHTWIRTYLESSILTKIDRAGMMHSLEVRAPYLDPTLAGHLLGLPSPLLFHRGRGKVLSRELARRLLPAGLLHRPKKGLGIPQATWLRTTLRPRLEACLERSRAGDGWFRPEPIQTLWQAHSARRGDYRKALWSYLFSFPFQER